MAQHDDADTPKKRSPEENLSGGDPALAPLPEEVTRILHEWREGDGDALTRLTPYVYEELRRLAQGYMRGERGAHTLQATALVHEVYLRLVGTRDTKWQNRVHFLAIAAQTMRRVLVDHARAHRAERRGGGAAKISLDELQVTADEKPTDLVALDEALNELSSFDPQKCRIIELRFFGGLTIEETAELLELSNHRVWQETQLAKAWLFEQLSKGSSCAG